MHETWDPIEVRKDMAQQSLTSLSRQRAAFHEEVLKWRRGLFLACVALGVWTCANVAATGIVLWAARWMALHR